MTLRFLHPVERDFAAKAPSELQLASAVNDEGKKNGCIRNKTSRTINKAEACKKNGERTFKTSQSGFFQAHVGAREAISQPHVGAREAISQAHVSRGEIGAVTQPPK